MDIKARLKELDNHSNAVQNLNQRLDSILAQIDWNLDTKPVSVVSLRHPASSQKNTQNPRKSKQNDSILWCQSREQKLKNYQEAVDRSSEMPRIFADEEIPSGTNLSAKAKDDCRAKTMSLSEMTKLNRDLKRRRMRHRTTKAPPLSHTEELRALIELQMEAWQRFGQNDKKSFE